ncbi:UNVERIFIED_CONTAM: hypothetical protein FKN15_078493 [Acipenser sinensis]
MCSGMICCLKYLSQQDYTYQNALRCFDRESEESHVFIKDRESVKEEVKLSELVEVVVETEPEAGATGFSVSGGGNKGIFVKDVLKDSPAAKALSLREGDQLLSARVYFENVKYEDALKILQCAENYKVSYLLKRTVPGANISVSPSKGSLDIKGPKAKMPKLSVKSITPMKKKKKKGKASVKLSGGTSLPAGAEFNVEGTPAKLELSPVDVEFAFPKFSKLKKTGKAATGGNIDFTDLEAQPGAAIPWRKKRRIKFPRMRVKDAATAQVDVSGETPGGSIAVTPSKGKLELDVPDAKLKTKGKSPKFGIFFPKTKKAKVDVSLPKVDVDIKTLEAKFKPPKVELDIGMPTGKADITVPKPELEGKQEVKFKPPKLELNFGLPSGKAEVPEVEIKGPAKDEIRLPKVGLDISLPAGKGDIPKPEVSVKGPKVDIKGGIEAPDGKVKGEGFKIKMPKFGISSQTSDLEGSAVEWDLDVESPEGKLKMPKVKLPKIGISLPSDEFEDGVSAPRGEVDIEGPNGKHKGRLKMPSINIAAPKVDVDFSLPKGKAEMEADWKMPAAEGIVEAGMKGPGVEIKMPKVTLPKFGGSGATDYAEAKVSVPKADVKGSKAEVKVGKMEVESPDVKFKGPKMKMPSFGISSPKMKGEGSLPKTKVLDESAEGKMKLPKMPSIDISLPVPDLDLNLPLGKGTGPGAEIKGDVDTRSRGSRERLDMKLKKPKIYFPKFGLSGKEKEPGADIHISTPKVDVKEPKIVMQGIEIEGPSAKGAKISMPKIDFCLPKMKSPEAELDIHGMDIESSRSKGGKITMPEIDLSFPKMGPPKVELDVHGIEVEGPSAKGAKISMPKIDFCLPKMKSPEAELDIHGMDIESSRSKGGKITMPEIDLSFPKMGPPKVELDVHGIEVEGPSAKGAKISMPKIDFCLPKMKSPEAELDIHGMDIESSRSKGGKITMPEIDLSFPKMGPPKVELDVHGIEVEGPSAKGAKISMPKIDFCLPKMKSPEAELDIHGMDIESSRSKGGKITMPEIDLSFPKMGPPKVELDVHGIEVEGPSAKGAKISMPKIDFCLPKMKSPEAELDIHGMDIESSRSKGGKITMPEIDLSFPKMGPPKVELDVHGIEVEGPSAKGAKISMPKIDFCLPKMKSPEAELDIHGMDIEGSRSKGGKTTMPEIDLSLPKIKSPEAELDVHGIEVEGPSAKGAKISMPKMDLSLPKMKSPEAELDIHGMDIKGSGFKGGKITVPKIDLSLPKIKFPAGDISVLEGKIKVKGSKVEGDETDARLSMPSVKMPAIDIDMPKIDLDLGFLKTDAHVEGGGKVPEHPGAGGSFEGPDIHLKMPKISLPKFGIKGSEGDADVDLDLKGQVKPPKAKAEIKGTDIGDPKVKGPGITMPTFGITFGKGKETEIDVKAPKGKRDISSPELKTGIKPPKAKSALKGHGFEAEGIDAKLKLPTVKMPSFDISVPKLPDVNFDIKMPKGKAEASVEGDISGQSPSAEGPDFEIKMPKLPTFSKGKGEVKIEAPEIDVEGPDGKLTGPKLKMPTFGISFPKGKSGEAGLEGELDVSRPTLKAPEVKVKAPKGKLEVTRPDVDIDTKGGKVKLPTLKLPSVDISSPKVDIDFGLPKAKGNDKEQIGLLKAEGDRPSSGASFDVPDVSLKMPKFSLPKFGGMAKAGAVDLEVPKAEVKVTPPKINVEGRAPSVESDVDGKAKGKEGKMKMPRIKMPSFGISKKEGEITVSSPEIDTRVKKGKVEIEAPEVELEGPEGKVKTQNKFAKFKMSSPKGKGPEIEAKVDTGFSGKGGFEAPDVTLKMPKISMPKFGSKGADIDLGTPDADLESKGKIKMPALEISLPAVKQPEGGLLPKAEVDVSEADIKGYEGDLKIPKMPTIDISAPKIELDIGLSKAKAGASLDSDADIKADVDKGFEGSDFKLKMPKISLPTFGISGSKEQDIELDMRGAKSDISNQAEIKTPELHISTPKATIDTPDYEIGDGDGKLKMPKIKMPKVDVSEADIKGYEGDLKIPKMPTIDISAPKIELDIGLSKANAGASLDSDAGIKADVDKGFEGSDFKLKMPKISLPTFGISGSKEQDIELDMRGAKSDISNQAEIKTPELHISTPKATIDTPDYEIEDGDGKLKMPKIKMPKLDISLPKGKTGEADMSLTEGKVRIEEPDFDGDGESKFKLPSFGLPKFSSPTVKAPELDLEFNLGKPKHETEIAGPHIKGPKIEGMGHHGDTEGEFKMKGPKIKMPKVEISGPVLKGADVEIDAGLPKAEEKGKIEIKPPKIEGSIDISSKEIKGPKVKGTKFKIGMPKRKVEVDAGLEADMKKTDIDEEGAGGRFKIKMPKFGMSKGKVEAPELETSVDIEGGDSSFKMPQISLPDVGFSSSKGGDADVGVDMSLPKAELDLKKDIKVKGPKAEGKIKVDAPELEGPEGHLKMLKFKMPSIGISVSKDQGEGEAEFTAKGNLEGKTKKHHFKMPGVEISATKVKADGQDGELGLVLPEDNEEIKLKMPKISMPSVGFSDSKDKEASVESITPEDDSKGEGFKIKMPKFGISSKTYDHEGPAVEADLNVEGPEGKLKMPKVKLPKIGISCPSGEFEGGTDLSAPRGEVDIEGPEGKRKGGLKMPSINIAAPKVDLDFSLSKGKDEADLKMPEAEGTAEASMKGPGVEIKMPKVTLPKFGGSGVTEDAEALPKGVGIGGKTKVDVKDQKVDIKAPKVEIKAPEVEVGSPELDTDKKSKVKIPKFGIELPKLTEPQAEIDVSAPDAKVKVKGPEIKGKDSEVPSKSGETDGKYEGPKMPKVKKAVFVFVKPKTNGSSTSLLESEGSVGSAEAKIRMPKIKMKPTFGKSQSTTKGVKVKGEADGDEGEGEGEGKTKSGKIKLPKVTFSPGKTGSFDVTLNGSGGKKGEGSGPHVNGESEPTFQNGSQEDKAKFGKLKLPKIEISSPYTKGAEGDAEMSMKPGKTEETSGDDGEGKGMKFKSPKITFPGFEKKGKGEEEKPGTLVSSTARTEMALLESGDKITTESSAKPKVSIGFVSGRSKGEYTVESSASSTCSESGGVPTLRGVQGVDEQKTEGKEKSPKFRLPKFSLSPRSKGILEISPEGSPQGSRDSLQQTRGAESSSGFKIQMPRLGFKTSQEVHTTEEQTMTVEEGGIVVGSKTLKHTATASMTERSTTI